MTDHELPPLHLIILAGGQSARARRSDSTPPKQFVRLGGEMLLMRSVQELSSLAAVTSLIVVAPEPWHPVAQRELAEANLSVPCHLAPGGVTRTESTWHAILILKRHHEPAPGDLVAVHDAARPFATHHLLLRLAQTAARYDAAVPGIPVSDTIALMREGKEERVEAKYLERKALRALQTPQVFRWEPFQAAHQWCQSRKLSFTDDGGLLATRGVTPLVVMGEQENWKVTTEGDLARAESLLRTI